MEKTKENTLNSQRDQARSLLKNCFRNRLFSFVPYEIWKEIVCYSHLNTICFLAQTCWGFKELVEDVRSLDLALKYRREGDIDLALKYLQRCANCGCAKAMFHLGYALRRG